MEITFDTKIEIDNLAENITFDDDRKSIFIKKREGDIRQVYLPDFTTRSSQWELIDELHGLAWVTPQMLHNVVSFLKYWKSLECQ